MIDHYQVVAMSDVLQRLLAEIRQRAVVPDQLDPGVEALPRLAAGPQRCGAAVVIPAEPAQDDAIRHTRNRFSASSSNSSPSPGAVGSSKAPSTMRGSVRASAPRMIMCG